MNNQVLEVIKKRSSARAYSDEDVTKEQLEKVIEAGLQGPTGMNKKEIHFTVVKGDAPILEELDGIQALQDFADKLEAATIKTIEDGKMTKDLALITTLENPTVLNSENFIKAIRETLEGML